MLNFLQKKIYARKRRVFHTKKKIYIKHNHVKQNVFVWKTFKRRGFEDRAASVAEKKEHQRSIQFVFFVFFRSEEQYYCVRFVVRR